MYSETDTVNGEIGGGKKKKKKINSTALFFNQVSESLCFLGHQT